ncbi:hypothetical protein H4I95_03320 [Botrytis cinerea]
MAENANDDHAIEGNSDSFLALPSPSPTTKPDRNHTTSDLYEDRTSKRPTGISKKEDSSAQNSSGEETGDEIVVDENPLRAKFSEDEATFENSSHSKMPTYGKSSRNGISKRTSLYTEYPARPNSKGWKCPKPGCTVCRKVQFDLITHWQEAHSDIPEPAHFEFVHGPKSSENTATPTFGVNDHRLGGQSASAHQPARPNQEEETRGNVNDGARGPNTQQQREDSANTTGNKDTKMNELNAQNAATSTPSNASSHFPAAASPQSRFANMPLPRDQDSDEEDLRPSHVLRQERRAIAGKSVKPIRAGEYFGVGKKIYGEPKKMGKSTGFLATRLTDSDDDSIFEGNELSSSGSSFGETEAPVPVVVQQIISTHVPPTPFLVAPLYQPYQVYGPDLDSPPHPTSLNLLVLSTALFLQPEDLFDADDIFFGFQDMTPHEREVQDRLDAEKEATRANSYGSGFRAPLHFDHCPYTAPICRAERATWIAERLRLDVAEARGDESEDPESPLGMDSDDDRRFGVDVEMSGTGKSTLSKKKKKRATCSGPIREKRKYNWNDPMRKNKRRKGSISAGTSRGIRTRRSNSRGDAQIDGANEQEEEVVKNRKPAWAWSEAHGSVIDTRKPVELVRPGTLAAEGDVATTDLVDRASATHSVGLDTLNASRAPVADTGSAKTSFVLSDG